MEILNKTKIGINSGRLSEAGKTCLKILKIKPRKRQKISVAFVSSGEMKRLNKKYTGRDGVTDVLSFNFDSEDCLGEIIICPSKDALTLPRVSLPAEKRMPLSGKRRIDFILTRLLIHGILHLAGHDHEKNISAEKKMWEMENKVLEKLKI